VRKYRFLCKLLGPSRDAATALMAHGTDSFYLDAAEELARRGFDAVTFGHTHLPGVLPLNGDQALYLNTGSCFSQPYYVKINRGEVELKAWQG
jgi:UDP-2,3-diacylglucosamine pyrophosphatase LpxH